MASAPMSAAQFASLPTVFARLPHGQNTHDEPTVQRCVGTNWQTAVIGNAALTITYGSRKIRIRDLQSVDHDGRARNIDRMSIDIDAKSRIACHCATTIRGSAGAVTGDGNDFR